VNFLDIFFASLLANNLLFFHFLGLGEFLSEVDRPQVVRRTVILGVLLVVGAVLFWVPDHFLLVAFHLTFLRTLVLLLVVFMVTAAYAAVVPSLGAGVPSPREFVVHSLLVGAVVLVGSSSPDVFEVLTAAVAVVLGYGLAVALLRSVFQRLSRERIPAFVQGLPLQLLTLGLVWLVLHGLAFAFTGKAL
jgi:electron transport complex protein RnfA